MKLTRRQWLGTSAAGTAGVVGAGIEMSPFSLALAQPPDDAAQQLQHHEPRGQGIDGRDLQPRAALAQVDDRAVGPVGHLLAIEHACAKARRLAGVLSAIGVVGGAHDGILSGKRFQPA